MRQLKNGSKLCVVLALALSAFACRKSVPPPIDVCIGDGMGGMDCVTKAGAHVYLPPTQTKNMWATSQADMARLLAWCYDADVSAVERAMQEKAAEFDGSGIDVAPYSP